MNPVQAIAGVSVGRETEVETLYPSIAAGSLGRFIGQLMELPKGISSSLLRILCLSFLGLMLAPLSVLSYFLGKLTGKRHVITNRRVSPQRIIARKSIETNHDNDGVLIKDVAEIEIATRSGDAFFRTGDLILKDGTGRILMQIPGIPNPQRVQHLLQTLRSAQSLSAAALEQIELRQVAR
ncbi:MAG TPA: hypothetical protein VNQ76_06940 [Planctomicrobium sp.]|nr:hypothetical protein [Planctomicrobium sp.]